MEGGFGRAYNDIGVKAFYEQTGNSYFNPHKYDIERLIRKKLGKGNDYLKACSRILDLACGGGEATLPLLALGYKDIVGTDPYTSVKYKEQTQMKCYDYNFLQILNGALDQNKFDAIICSYALHIVKEGMMHDFCKKIADISPLLIIISPHKFPVMKEAYGWKEIEHSVQEKIHFRAYSAIRESQCQS